MAVTDKMPLKKEVLMNRISPFVLCLFLLFTEQMFGKVRILTFHYNQADFIELQHRCLKRFMLDDYELIVFNDAATLENEKAIEETCKKLGVQCVRFEQKWHLTDPLNEEIKKWVADPTLLDPSILGIPSEKVPYQPSVRHCHVIQYALDNYGYNHDDIVAIMDGDAFFIRDISLKQKLEEFDIMGMTRDYKKVYTSYLWVPFIAFNPTKLPNLKDLKFNVAVIDRAVHDSGAQTYHYLAANPSVKCKKTFPVPTHRLRHSSEKELKQAHYNGKERWLIKNLPKHTSVELDIESCIVHFRGVSFEFEDHPKKMKCLTEFMDKIFKAKR